MENGNSTDPSLHRLIAHSGDFYLSSLLATALTKLVLRSHQSIEIETVSKNTFACEVLLILVALLRLGSSSVPKNQIDEDSHSRIALCVEILSNKRKFGFAHKIFLEDCSRAFSEMLVEQRKEKEDKEAKKEKVINTQVDSLITVPQLLEKKFASTEQIQELGAMDLMKATGFTDKQGDTDVTIPLLKTTK